MPAIGAIPNAVTPKPPTEYSTPNSEAYDLAGVAIGLAMRARRTLGPGFLESVYRNALCLELSHAELDFETEKELTVRYRDRVVGTYRADLIVSGGLLVEIKAVNGLLPAHEVQLINYLAATSMEIGLLLSFGNYPLQFMRKTRTPRAGFSPDISV